MDIGTAFSRAQRSSVIHGYLSRLRLGRGSNKSLQALKQQNLPEQVCTNNDAAFQCNFLFNIFLILWVIFDFQLISIDFAIDFAIFTMWLQMYGWIDGQTDGQNTEQTDRIMGGQTNEWIDMQCRCIDMQKNMIFQ